MCLWRCNLALPLRALFQRAVRVEENSAQRALSVCSVRLAHFATPKYCAPFGDALMPDFVDGCVMASFHMSLLYVFYACFRGRWRHGDLSSGVGRIIWSRGVEASWSFHIIVVGGMC
jgi:hypothetical protein